MRRFLLASILTLLIVLPGAAQEKKVLRAGIIGLDTSHVVAFTKILNSDKAEGPLAGVKIVAAYPAGTDIAASKTRVEGFTKTLKEKFNVEIVDSVEALLPKVDVVFLESVDGRPHLQQAIPVLKAKKPLFIDKPIAASLADTIAILELAKELNVPCFSSSSLRFAAGIAGMKSNDKVGTVVGCTAYGPCPLEPTHPDLFWYGIHGVETLFTIMGPGCETVTRIHSADADVVVGTWSDGRIGTFRGIRKGKADYGALVFGSKGIAPSGGYGGYEPLVVEICKFFQTGKVPVSAAETINLVAFMEAADESKRQGGKPVKIADVMAKARAELEKRQGGR